MPVDRPIIFLHIVKTAGTSVVEFFRELFGADEVLSHGDFLLYHRSEPLPADLVGRCRFISGHFGFSQISDYLDGAYSFTFLRHPLDRILSLYRFCLHEDMQKNFAVARAARDLGLEGFMLSDLPEVAEIIENQQTWQLAHSYWGCDRPALASLSDEELLLRAQAHLKRFTHVGLTETFEEDFRQILRDLQLDETATIPHELQTADPVARTRLTPATEERLRERMELDFRLYESVRTARGLPT